MYPRNASSPPSIYAKVVDASDGSAITSGVTAYHIHDGSRAEAGGTLTHLGAGGWRYVPTQAETNYATFAVEFYHSGAVSGGPMTQVVTTTVYDTSFSDGIAGAVRVGLGMASANLDAQLVDIHNHVVAITVPPHMTSDQWSALRQVLGIPNTGTTPVLPTVGVMYDIIDGFTETGFDNTEFVADVAEAVSAVTGTADWTADQRTAIATILGIPVSGTTPVTPTEGVLGELVTLFDLTGFDSGDLVDDIVDGVGGSWNSPMTESYSTVGSPPSPAQALFELLSMRDTQIVGATRTTYQLDGNPAMTFTLTLDAGGKPFKQERTS